jgi:hypothetical protein
MCTSLDRIPANGVPSGSHYITGLLSEKMTVTLESH